MLDELKARLLLSTLEAKDIQGISDLVQLDMYVEDNTIQVVEEDGYLHLSVDHERIGKVESASSAFREIAEHLGHEVFREVDVRIPQDKLNAMVDAYQNGEMETVRLILETSSAPAWAYEGIFHVLMAGVRIGENNIMRELYGEENHHRAFPYPEYYEHDAERRILTS